MREIVTIQVGDFANFIGSHFWNFQDELLGLAEDSQADVVFRNQCLNMDLLYRTGETQQGILTYTPRLVSIGFQGSLGSMSSRGTLYNEKQPAPFDVVTWSGNLSSQVSEPQKKNLFLQSLYKEEEKFHMMNGNTSVRHNIHSDISDKDIVECLENEVQYWTDFSKVHYHPRSLYELSGLWVDVQQFNNFGIGRDAFSDSLRGEEMNESLRFFIEECDHIQGIQFVIDDSGGFSGVAAEFLENIADEYTNTPVLLYSVRDPGQINPSSQRRTVCQNLHDAISFSRLSSFCKLIVPVGLPSLCESKVGRFLCIDNGKPYHTSAVYASAIHSISLPFRMEPLGPTDESLYVCGAVDMNGAIQMLGGQARQNIVTILDVAMPVPPLTGTQAEQSVLENLHPLTPETSEDVEDLQAVESLTIHGAHGSGSHRASVSEVKEAVQASYEHVVTRPRFSHLSVASCPLPIPLPFPSIFANLVGKHGELLGSPISSCTSRGSVDVHSIPMSARLRSSTAILPFLEHRLRNLQRFGIQRGALGNELLRSWGFGKDEVEDIGEALSKMVMTLDPHSEECSDSD